CHTTLFSCDTFFVFRTFTMPAMHRQECLHPSTRNPGAFWGPQCLCHTGMGSWPVFFDLRFMASCFSMHSRGRLCYTSMSGSLSLVNLMPVVLAIWHRQECLCHTSLVIAQHILQYPVHDEVGIAADGGSEVSVSWRGEGEVAFIDF